MDVKKPAEGKEKAAGSWLSGVSTGSNSIQMVRKIKDENTELKNGLLQIKTNELEKISKFILDNVPELSSRDAPTNQLSTGQMQRGDAFGLVSQVVLNYKMLLLHSHGPKSDGSPSSPHEQARKRERRIIRELQAEIEELKSQNYRLGAEITSFGNPLDHDATIERQRYDLSRKENEARETEKIVKGLITEKNALEVRLQSTLASLGDLEQYKHEIERLQHEKQTIEKNHDRQRNELEREIHRLHDALEDVRQSFQQREVAIRTQVRSECEDKLREKLKVNEEQKIKEIEEYNAHQLAESFAQAEANQLKAEDDKKRLQQEISDLQLLMAKEIKNATKTAEKYYSKQVQQVQSEMQTLTDALVSRERVKMVTDAELQKTFSGVARAIDQLSRIEWKKDDPDWPVDLLKTFSQNLRKTRQQILQDRLWAILYTRIFCSPFRIFGVEGLDLEKQWASTFGGDSSSDQPLYGWPTPHMKAERWRYELFTNFKETLRYPPSKHHRRFKLLEEFRKSEKSVKDDISALISKVGDVDDDVRGRISQLCELAVVMWVDFGALRCRLQVLISAAGVDSTLQKTTKAKAGSLQLTALPELRRWGTWKGDSLADITPVVSGKPDLKYKH